MQREAVVLRTDAALASLAQPLQALVDNIERVIFGKREEIELALIPLLAGGHRLVDDLPGTGKTMLARALARSLALDFHRIQFTPDLMPSDVTGVSIFNQKNGAFEFIKGPVFTQVLLADEVNRATPRAQSALLECMAEHQVSVDGVTHKLPRPFMVIATQNPIEMLGTYRLPEAQLDPFLLRISMGYPHGEAELRMLASQTKAHPIDALSPVLNAVDVVKLRCAVQDVHVSSDVARYIVRIVEAIRHHPRLRVGASPRGSLALQRASQARALLDARAFVDPATVKRMVVPTLAHRVVTASGEGWAETSKILAELVACIAPPVR